VSRVKRNDPFPFTITGANVRVALPEPWRILSGTLVGWPDEHAGVAGAAGGAAEEASVQAVTSHATASRLTAG
jgi:hypothetical protein